MIMKNIFSILFAAVLLFSGCREDDESTKVNIEITNSQVSSNSIDISWESVEGALYYEVIITPDDEGQTAMTGAGTSFSFSDLKANTEYNIMVKAGASIEKEKIIGEGSVAITTESLPQELAGTWIYYYNDIPFAIYSLKNDGSGTYTYDGDQRNIIWSLEDEQLVIETFNENGSSYTNRYDYSLNEDQTLLTIDSTHYFLQE